MSTNRTSQDAGWVGSAKLLPRGPNGRALCRRCGQEVPPGRRTFCSAECVHEWRLRSDPGYLRDQAFKRDRGVCADCGADTIARDKVWREEAREFQRSLDRACHGLTRTEWRRRWNAWEREHRTGWQADHIVPVVEGGGECGLDNIRTLCSVCHNRVTAELAARRAAQRQAESQQVREAELVEAGNVRLF